MVPFPRPSIPILGLSLPSVPINVAIATVVPMTPKLGQQGDVALRFEVTNEDGSQFISNVPISIVLEDGRPVMTKLSDNGGNAAFTWMELQEAVERRYGADPTVERNDIFFRAEAEGYEPASGLVFDAATERTVNYHKIALQSAKASGLLPILGLAAVAGLLFWAVK